MKITPEHIDRLYRFTREHFVEWYDLQTELVDHLANAIEKQWEENPKIPFEEALQTEFKKFGVFGFMDVVEKRQAALEKKYRKIIWQHFKAFFTLPKILTTATAFAFFWVLLKNLNQAHIIVYVFLIGAVLSFWILTIAKKFKAQKKASKTTKKWLFKEMIFGYGNVIGLSYLPLQFIVHLDFDAGLSNLQIGFFSFFIVALYLLEYIILFEIPSKATTYLRETYPEYVLMEEV